MRRTAALLLAGALLSLPLGATPALACAQPDEGQPHCCEPPTLYVVDVGGHTVGVPDPTWQPWRCE
ncbi:MAG: hypothetical protein QOE45_533 [Frankiaceae bacterium]|jgi:hypothetical protein|nr:hypothetical protein [Frankiaceae bacterium]